MKLRNILITVFLLLMPCTSVWAQFNTVGRLWHPPLHKAEKPQAIDGSSLADSLVSMDSLHNVQAYSEADSCRGKVPSSGQACVDILLYLNVALPLKSIRINSGFGMRRHPVTRKCSMHNGLDLQACYEPVISMLTGRVVKVAGDKRSGRYVTIRTGNYTVSYCHLSSSQVTVGQYVKAGEVIGVSGNTGMSTGPHLHLTTKKDGKAIDPIILLKCVRAIVSAR